MGRYNWFVLLAMSSYPGDPRRIFLIPGGFFGDSVNVEQVAGRTPNPLPSLPLRPDLLGYKVEELQHLPNNRLRYFALLLMVCSIFGC